MDSTATRERLATSFAISSALILAISAIVHLLIAAAVVEYAAPAPFVVEPEAGIEVELVAPDEAAKEESKPEEKPEEKPDLQDPSKAAPERPAATPPPAGDPAADKDAPKEERKDPAKDTPPPPASPPAAPAEQVQPQTPPGAAGEPPAAPPAATEPPATEAAPPFAPEMMAQMSKLERPGDFDDAATGKAKLTPAELAAFRAAVQACWTPPPGLAAEPRLKVMIRVSFKRNGALAGEPMLIAGTASRLGPILMRAAQDAVRRCQPYAVLPAAKYREWRVLDLPFSPGGISGG